MRRFAGIDLISDRIPDESTILTFRYLLEKHDLGHRIQCLAEDFVDETFKSPLNDQGMTSHQPPIFFMEMKRWFMEMPDTRTSRRELRWKSPLQNFESQCDQANGEHYSPVLTGGFWI